MDRSLAREAPRARRIRLWTSALPVKRGAVGLAPRKKIVRDLAGEIAKNLAMTVPSVRDWRLQRPRTAGGLEEISAQELEERVFMPFQSLVGAIPREEFRGASVVEIGPGDNLALGLAFLALGAREYHAIDRFMGNVAGERARRLYEAEARVLPEWLGVSARDIFKPADFPAALLQKKVFLYPRGIEGCLSMPLGGKADWVFSHSVGHSIALPEALARATEYFLRPGGRAVHALQFGPTGCWTEYRNPLTFLTIPEAIWPWTTSHRGSSNRARFHEFCAMFTAAGLSVETEILEEFTAEQLEEARPYLARRFALAPRESLRVRFAKFDCRKPGPASPGKGSAT